MAIDLITDAQKLWSLRRSGLLTADEHEIALFALETSYGLDVAPCGKCGIRHAQRWAWGEGVSLCFHCREVGDLIDQAWTDYKDATDAEA